MKFYKPLTFLITSLLLVTNLDTNAQILNEYSEIVFKRAELLMGIGSWQKLNIRINGKSSIKLKEHSTESILIPAGENSISGQITRSTSFNLHTEPNMIYYLQAKIGGLFLDKPKFKLVRVVSKTPWL
ncbi:hypothetical protein [Lacihabitans soyangensis]|uniref:Uncharacterized protein n=1 Tax=Lacihabitans soyangensis TaxID=869394 RepID=A0AAE3H925_9BACT|nr:hypothetical protein [Lacihabitans soyangensis]MCP9765675.1 hypothetical protein [Lacihabitans soyangensis]